MWEVLIFITVLTVALLYHSGIVLLVELSVATTKRFRRVSFRMLRRR